MGDVNVRFVEPPTGYDKVARELIEAHEATMRHVIFGGVTNRKMADRVAARDIANCGLTRDDFPPTDGWEWNPETDHMEKTDMMEIHSMQEQYANLVTDHIMRGGCEEVNSRTKVKIKMSDRPRTISLDLANGRLPVPNNRRYYPHIAATETAWQFMGTQDPDFVLERAPKLWSKFVEDGKLKTAYGYRWQHHFGRNQLDQAVQQLRDNPTNRQLYVSAWDPSTDGLGDPDQPKNIPCPVGFSLTRVEDRINMAVFVRSSDVFVGLPYDVMCYALTLDAIAASVGIKTRPGFLHFTLAHPHIYEPHWEMSKKSEGVRFGRHDVEPNLPGWDIDMILANPDGYIKTVKHLANRVHRPEWDPTPEIVE